MSDDLDNQFSSTQGQSPSPDFVAALREQIVTESKAQPQTGAQITEVEFTSEREQGMTATRKMAIGLVAAAIVLIGGFAIFSNGNDSQEVNIIEGPPETTSSTVSTTTPSGPSGEDLLGSWVASFGPTWEFEADRILVTGGSVRELSYVAFDTTIQFSDDSGCPFGMYNWEIEEDVLTLSVLNDECGGRVDNWDGATFERAD